MPPRSPVTLALDIGGTGLKAGLLGPHGELLGERLRVATTYPMPPERMVAELAALVRPLPAFQRISVGFPGVVRHNRVLTAPHFVTKKGPGSKPDPGLVTAWRGFELGAALGERLGQPARVVNDADLQGAAVITGHGLELVVTLGTGVGTGLFWQGHVAPHLELAQHPLGAKQTYNERIGDAARKRIGAARWRARVGEALTVLTTLITPDRIFVGGGNAARLSGHEPDGVTIVSNDAGLLGGIKLWDSDVFSLVV